ncbi:hypothetical protein ACFSYG_08300 [Leeuwenhoekiella polynyae]|nr:hypothetical protein [Leeuwenhoekiella polynyae]
MTIDTPSAKTLTKAYNYCTSEGKNGSRPSKHTLNRLCKYLGYNDFAEFVEKNKVKERVYDSPDISQKDENDDSSVGTATVTNQKNWRSISIFGTFALTLIIAVYFIAENNASELGASVKCMTWTGTVYEEISCSAGSYSEYGTAIEPYDQKRFENFRRIDVDITTLFFSEQNQKPLVWYYKNETGEIEYYTAPGVHPVNGKTLKAVTEYIIEKYVPIHQNKSSSFIRD